MASSSKQQSGQVPNIPPNPIIEPEVAPEVTPTTTAAHVQDQIKVWKHQDNQITFRGRSGFFVKKEELEACSDFIDDRLEHDQGEQIWSDLSDEMDSLRNQCRVANLIITDLRNEVKDKSVIIKDMQLKHDYLLNSNNEALKKAQDGRQDLLSQLEAAKAAKASIEKEIGLARRGSDVDLAETLSSRSVKISSDLKSIQDHLTKVNLEKNTLSSERNRLQMELKEASNELAELRSLLDKAEKMKKASLQQPGPKIAWEDSLPPIRSKAVSKLLGERGLKWLKNAQEVISDDYKDRSLKLMSAARTSKNANVKSLGDLLEVVFKWLKAQAYRARAVIADWLTEIESDLRTATVKPITYYRDALQRIADERKLEIESINIKKAEKAASEDGIELESIDIEQIKAREPTFFENAWTWVRVLSLETKRIFITNPKHAERKKAPVPRAIGATYNYISRVCKSVWEWFVPDRKQYRYNFGDDKPNEVLFEQ